MYIVYCITNVTNGKRYVGWSSKTIEKRWKVHIKNAIVRKRKFLLSEAIRKYGTSNNVWVHEQLAQVETPQEAKIYEVRFITQLNTNALNGGHGYNMTNGGDGGTATGKANPFYGRHHTPETIEKIRQSMPSFKGKNNPQYGLRGELSPNWGVKRSVETRQRQSDAARGKAKSEIAKQNMRIAAQNPETKRKRSEAQKKAALRRKLAKETK